jgi:serine/threonine protein kinase
MGSVVTTVSEVCESLFVEKARGKLSNNDKRLKSECNFDNLGKAGKTRSNRNGNGNDNETDLTSTRSDISLYRDTLKEKFLSHHKNMNTDRLNISHQNLFTNLNSRNKLSDLSNDTLHLGKPRPPSKTYDACTNNTNNTNNKNVKIIIPPKSPTYSLADFEILNLLGKGTFGKVFLVKNKCNGKLYAMKILKKERIIKTRQLLHTKNEREILEKINHPFIVKLFYAFQNNEKLYLVTEFMQGGELFFHLKKEHVFTEEKAKLYACEIVLAIEHLHLNKIIYRDLKPENVLLDESGHIKLTDFGLSKIFNNNNNYVTSSFNEEKAFTFCGTPEYLAPEILLGKGYNKSVDWWSFGILLYEMLCGRSPFKRRRERRLDINNYLKPIEVLKSDYISEEAQNLIMSLLKIEPLERLSDVKLIKSHPFFKGVDWEEVLGKKIVHEFIPKDVMKSEEDLRYFDTMFTSDSKHSDMYNILGNSTLSKKKLFLHSGVKGTKGNNGKVDEFEKFSYTREEELGN